MEIVLITVDFRKLYTKIDIINDGSTDNSLEVVKKWIDVLLEYQEYFNFDSASEQRQPTSSQNLLIRENSLFVFPGLAG